MNDLTRIAAVPGVASAVLGDMAGGFYDAIREADGESVAAVTGFISTSLSQAGEELGLGGLVRVTLAGATRACLIAVSGATVVNVGVASPAALAGVERALAPHTGG
jgi:hypothetical protein